MGVVVREVPIVQARDIHPGMVLEIDARVVVILVLGIGLVLNLEAMMKVVLKVVEVYGVEEPSECKNIDMLKEHTELESNNKK
jgi:hypothetical protein